LEIQLEIYTKYIMDDVIISGITGLPKPYLSKVIFEIIKMKDKDNVIYQLCSKYNRDVYKYSPKMREEFKEKFCEAMLYEIVIR
jgi:hypothetical protein